MMANGRTFLVECYLPGVQEAAVVEAGKRARAAADEMRRRGSDIAYIGATLVAADEVVFHTFSAADPAIVDETSRVAGLSFERVVESIGVYQEPDLPGVGLD